MADYSNYFRAATGFNPYPYQSKLASLPVVSRALRVPTGAGKTAAVILSWLYRLQEGLPDAPRRMAYCLPMRALVEQTRDQAARWKTRLGSNVQIATLMGGELEESWEILPESPTLLIGTQDMLLSRALNRGYGMKRYRWPVHFGLLNNDIVWVCDEVQLMADGLATTTQLAAFRDRFGTLGRHPTIWMSATMDLGMLATVDASQAPELIELDSSDYPPGAPMHARLHGVKRIGKAPEHCRRPEGLAQFLAANHTPGTQTIAVVNRVARARETFDELRRMANGTPCHLLHSRFRPWERRDWQTLFEEQPPSAGRILVATQVIEAGVDISSALMVTDLAQWPSLVQRFGRCNRAGELASGAQIYWVDRPLLGKTKFEGTVGLTEEIASPYSINEMETAEERVAQITFASPASLPEHGTKFMPKHVLRQRDLIDLFDTTADLSGYDLDVSRFIRSEQDRDVQIAWRDDYPPRTKDDGPTRDELCSAPIGEVAALLRTATKGRRRLQVSAWNALDSQWQEITDGEKLRPGMVLIADAKSGGYDTSRGWDPESTQSVPVVPAARSQEEGNDDDHLTYQHYTQTLAAHSREVRERMSLIVEALLCLHEGLLPYREELLEAALHHDWGKAHPVFQATVNPSGDDQLIAKSKKPGAHKRKHFRHELASALALLQTGASDLCVYLAAAHHGKVRLSIRALPGEIKPGQEGTKFARGVYDGDSLPHVRFDGSLKEPLTIDLEPMQLGLSPGGARSWMERMLDLRDRPDLGVFKLAYLEALMVAADCRASGAPEEILP
jgi:CRISPR-associated endonuclease/helicase Cas3